MALYFHDRLSVHSIRPRLIVVLFLFKVAVEVDAKVGDLIAIVSSLNGCNKGRIIILFGLKCRQFLNEIRQ